MSMYQAVHGFGRDAKAVKGKKLERDLLRRVLQPRRAPTAGSSSASSSRWCSPRWSSAVPPLILRAVIDTAIPEKDRQLVALLAAGAVFLAAGQRRPLARCSATTRPASVRV